MIICSGVRGDYHEEIVYDNGTCPLCQAIQEIKSRDNEIEALTEEVNDGK